MLPLLKRVTVQQCWINPGTLLPQAHTYTHISEILETTSWFR